MASEEIISTSAASVVEDVIKQPGTRLSYLDLASRKAEEAATRRFDAAAWLRRTVGVVLAKDLPEQPSEEEFRFGLRNGIILCNAINRVQPGGIPKVVEAPDVPDGAALSAYQYFENVRNFLVGLEDLGLPTFEACDLEKGGKGSRVVDSVLALKSHGECKQMGRKYGGILKPANSSKSFIRKNSEAFMNSLSRSQSLTDNVLDAYSLEHSLSGDFSFESIEMENSQSLNMLVRTVLSDKKPEEVPLIVEAMLSKVMQEFERRITNQNEMVKTTLNDLSVGNKSVPEPVLSSSSPDKKMEPKEDVFTKLVEEDVSAKHVEEDVPAKPVGEDFPGKHMEEDVHANLINMQASIERSLKQQSILDINLKSIKELKHVLHTARADLEFMKSGYSEEFNNLGKHLRVLSTAASGYHKVLEENRKLYNQVQDLKGNIRVYCRVRPFLPGQSSATSTVGHIDDGSIAIISPLKYGKEARRSFNFNKVFGPSATQAEIFSDTQPLIRSVLDGYNVCIFAYGQTGSGKTHTMSGPNELNEQTIGVNYRALNDLFYLSEQRKDTFHYDISVQMIEIYNEQVRDLLATDGQNKRLEIRNSSQKGLNVPDANVVPVASPSDVIELMNLGHRNRAVSSTAMNDRSSRSHSCLTIHVQGKDMTSTKMLRGCMHLVDLAGSERVDKSEVKGERLKEAQHINKSLSALGDVISSLSQNNAHVPYRNSKLTQLLQDSLGGQAKTLMFVHMSPEVDAIGETLGTLKFAERVATVELGAAKANKDTGEVKELKEQIACLKAALARKEEDVEPLRSTLSSPDIYSMKSGTSSPAHPYLQHERDTLDGLLDRRQPMEDSGNVKDRNNCIQMQKPNFDIQEFVTTGDSPWQDNSSGLNLAKGDARDMGYGEWLDKSVVNKLESGIRDDDSEGDGDLFYQRSLPNTRKHSPEIELQRSRFDSDSEDLEIATSDCSEVDMQWQLGIPNTSAINGSKSKIKKPQAKPLRTPDIRPGSQSHIPSPARKVKTGSVTPNRTGKGGGVEARRPLSSGGKVGNGK